METTEILELFDEQMRRKAAPDSLFVGDGWSAVLWRPDDGAVEPLVARMRELPGHSSEPVHGCPAVPHVYL